MLVDPYTIPIVKELIAYIHELNVKAKTCTMHKRILREVLLELDYQMGQIKGEEL
jgi:hypothetical protein